MLDSFSSFCHKNLWWFGTFSGSILNFLNFLSVQLLLNFVICHPDCSCAPRWWVCFCIREAALQPCCSQTPGPWHGEKLASGLPLPTAPGLLLTGAGFPPAVCTRPAHRLCSRWGKELERWWERSGWIYVGFHCANNPCSAGAWLQLLEEGTANTSVPLWTRWR